MNVHTSWRESLAANGISIRFAACFPEFDDREDETEQYQPEAENARIENHRVTHGVTPSA
jgi:hypothetical protein